MCSWPIIPAATSRARARSITASCSSISTHSATTAGSVANTNPGAAHTMASAGAPSTASEHFTINKEIGMMKVGFIGLGIMGAPMAGHLLAGVHRLYLHDIRNPPYELIE